MKTLYFRKTVLFVLISSLTLASYASTSFSGMEREVSPINVGETKGILEDLAELLDLDDIASMTTLDCDYHTFEIGSRANSQVGEMVKVKIEMSETEGIEVEYYETGGGVNEWRPVVFIEGVSMWGPSTGFPVVDMLTNGSPFRIRSQSETALTGITYSFVMVKVDDTDVEVSDAITGSFDVLPVNAQLLDLDNISDVSSLACDYVTFGIGSKANCQAGELVKVRIEMSETEGLDIEYYETSGGANEWRPVVFTDGISIWGPSTGFPVTDFLTGGSQFRLRSQSETALTGVTYSFVMVKADDTDVEVSNAITGSFDVLPVNAELLDLDNIGDVSSLACDYVTFGIGSRANCQAGEYVRVRIEMSQTEGLDIEYYETGSEPNEWRPVVFTDGVSMWGPSAGFPATDFLTGGSQFRLRSQSETALTGVTYSFVMVKADDTDVEVSNAITGSFDVLPVNAELLDLDNISDITNLGCDYVTFGIGSRANCQAGEYVRVRIEMSQTEGLDIEYYETGSEPNEWRPVVFTDGVSIWGPSTGFPVVDMLTGGSQFRLRSQSETVLTGVTYSFVMVKADDTDVEVSSTISGSFDVAAMPTVPEITGESSVCAGSTITLANATANGTWSSSQTTIATISETGVVTGLTAGTTTITYTVTENQCEASVTKEITVNASPVVAEITGESALCAGSTITLANTTANGTWSSSQTTVATINGSGVVTGVSAGTTTITYTVTENQCEASATKEITVNAIPTVAAITGDNAVCIGSTITLANTTANGTWSSSQTAVATINGSGVVTGVSAGTTTITYKVVQNQCEASVTKDITVNAVPTVAEITGESSVCAGATIELANTTANGTWSSSTETVATINESGVVTGVTGGTTTITYKVVQNQCEASATKEITVKSVDVAVSLENKTLTANATEATFQWLDCDNENSHIDNATASTFTPERTGNYAVEVTQNSCVDTSECTNVIISGIKGNISLNDITIYPNPTEGKFSVDLGNAYKNINASIYDQTGKLINEIKFSGTQIINLEINEPAGLYFVNIKTDDNSQVSLRIIKK